MAKIKDLTGKKFGRLTVVKRGESDKHRKMQWWCQCDCGNPELILVSGTNLRKGNTKSCGCLQKEIAKKNKEQSKTLNKYDLESKEYGIGYTSNLNQDGFNEFWFDKEDYDKIKDYHWSFGTKGSVTTKFNGKIILLHRLIMGVEKFEDQIDHIQHKRYDNRKSQLRIVDNSKNGMNNGIQINNKSGCTGVFYDVRNNKYMAYITVNNQTMYLGYFDTKEEAVKIRKEAEEKYFGEYSYDNSMSKNF